MYAFRDVARLVISLILLVGSWLILFDSNADGTTRAWACSLITSVAWVWLPGFRPHDGFPQSRNDENKDKDNN